MRFQINNNILSERCIIIKGLRVVGTVCGDPRLAPVAGIQSSGPGHDVGGRGTQKIRFRKDGSEEKTMLQQMRIKIKLCEITCVNLPTFRTAES